jgi:hypothetical protein
MKRTAEDKIKDYAYMTGRPFTYKKVMQDLGLARRTTNRAIGILAKRGDITLISAPAKGIYLATSDKMKARKRAQKLAAEAEDMRQNGDEYHQILSEVL